MFAGPWLSRRKAIPLISLHGLAAAKARSFFFGHRNRDFPQESELVRS